MRREDEEAARRRRSAELLAGADLFAGLDRVTLAKLAANLDRVSFRKGEAACIEGEPGDSLYIVSEGTFGVSSVAPATTASFGSRRCGRAAASARWRC